MRATLPPSAYLLYGARIFAYCVLLVIAGNTWADFELRLSADRNTMKIDETLTISLIAEGTTGPKGDPPIEKTLSNLQVLGQSVSTSIRIDNGRKQTRKTWTYTTRPISSGKIQIPLLQWNGKVSNALSVEVLDPNPITGTPSSTQATPQSAPTPIAPEIILESVTDRDQVAIRGQLLYTARVLYRVGIESGRINPPKFPDDVLKYSLGNNRYQKIIANQPYTVQEFHYALFPQKSGVLKIAPFSLEGRVIRNRTRQRIKRASKGREITVLPSPASFATDEWIPAKQLRIEETWSTPPENPLLIGQPITRKITLHVEGMPAEQLPALQLTDHPNMKFYPEQPSIDTQVLKNGVNGKRTETVVMIPTHTGKVTLAPIELRWWDTKNGGIKIARLPERHLNIVSSNNPDLTTNLQIEGDTDNNLTITGAGLSNLNTTPPSESPSSGGISWLWWCVTLLAASAWPILLWQWWCSRRENLSRLNEMDSTRRKHQRNQNQLLERAIRSARQGDAKDSIATLLRWAQYHWPNNPPSSLPEIASKANSSALSSAVKQLNSVRYQQEQKEWDGTLLAEAMQGLKKHSVQTTTKNRTLAALYP